MKGLVLFSIVLATDAAPTRLVESLQRGSTATVQIKFNDYGLAPLPDPQDSFIAYTHGLHCLHMVETMKADQENQIDQWHLNHCKQDIHRLREYMAAHPVSISDDVCSALFPPNEAVAGGGLNGEEMQEEKMPIVMTQRRLRGSAEPSDAAEQLESQFIWSRKAYDQGMPSESKPDDKQLESQFIWSRKAYDQGLPDESKPDDKQLESQFIWSRGAYDQGMPSESKPDDAKQLESQFIWSRKAYDQGLPDESKPDDKQLESQFIWSRKAYDQGLPDESKPDAKQLESQFIWSRKAYDQGMPMPEESKPDAKQLESQFIWSRKAYDQGMPMPHESKPDGKQLESQYIWSRQAYDQGMNKAAPAPALQSQYIWSPGAYEQGLPHEDKAAPAPALQSQYIWSPAAYEQDLHHESDAAPSPAPLESQFIWSRKAYDQGMPNESEDKAAPSPAPLESQYIWSPGAYDQGLPHESNKPEVATKKNADFNAKAASLVQTEFLPSGNFEHIEDLLREMKGFYFGLLVFKQQQGLDEGDEWKYLTQSEKDYLMKWRTPQFLSQSAVGLSCPRHIVQAWSKSLQKVV